MNDELKIKPPNAIPFRSDIALLYDDTRRFPIFDDAHDKKQLTELFEPTIKMLITSAGARSNPSAPLRILDAGCGTGRISIPFYRVYRALNEANGNRWPKLQIRGIDLSLGMLLQFRKNLLAIGEHGNKTFNLYFGDIRNGVPGRPYDLIIVQWLFHTMLDWRTAALQLDRSVREGTLLLTLEESSSYYMALDRDFSATLGEIEKRLWTTFHTTRDSQIGDLQRRQRPTTNRHGALHLPPSLRLGARVSDERVAQMFRVLGWESVAGDQEDGRIKVEQNFLVGEFIKYVVRERAFTNMRIGADDKDLESIYRNIAERLTSAADAAGWPMDLKLSFSGSATPKVFRKVRENTVPTIIIDTLRDTTSARRSHAGFLTFNETQLWLKLVRTVWVSLAKQGLGVEGLQNKMKLFGASLPYDPSDYVVGNIDKASFQILWHHLTKNVETGDVVQLAIDPKPPGDQRLIPQVSCCKLPSDVWSALKKSGLENKGKRFEDIACGGEHNSSVLKSLRSVQLIGTGSGDGDDNTLDTLKALSQFIEIADSSEARNIYIFTARDYHYRVAARTYGFLIATSDDLSYVELNQIWLLYELLIVDFLEFKSRRSDQFPPNAARPLMNGDSNLPMHVDREEVERLECREWPLLQRHVEKSDGRRLQGPMSTSTWRGNTKCEILLLSVRHKEARLGRPESQPVHRESKGLAYGLGLEENEVEDYVLDREQLWRDDEGKPAILHHEIGQGFNDEEDSQRVTDLIGEWKPKLVVLAGVAGGVAPGKTNFGDVVVADSMFSLGGGIQIGGRHIIGNGGQGRPISYEHTSVVNFIKSKAELWNGKLFWERPGVNRVHVAPWASAEYYFADPESLLEPKNPSRAFAYEIEGWRFAERMNALNAERSRDKFPNKYEQLPYIMIKGICDYCGKHNFYQTFAAARAGEFILYLWKEGLTEEGLRRYPHLRRHSSHV